MSDKFTKIVAVIALVIGLVAMFKGDGPSVGGLYNINPTQFISGFTAGGSNQFSVSSAGALTTSGAITSTAGISGTTGTLSSTLGVTATTTLSDGLVLNNSGICINFYATSSATRVHMTASTTTTVPNGAAGVMTFDYGACAY